MKKLLRIGVLCALLVAALCVGALADWEQGITETSKESGVTLTYYTAAGAEVTTPAATAAGDTQSGIALAEHYKDAEKIEVTRTGLTGDYCLLIVQAVKSGAVLGTPTEDTIVYIDQQPVSEGSATFTVYPKLLDAGYDYYIQTATTGALAAAAQFGYCEDYKMGDIDKDVGITASDAMFALQAMVGGTFRGEKYTTTQKTAADVDKDGSLTATDAMRILQKMVGSPAAGF